MKNSDVINFEIHCRDIGRNDITVMESRGYRVEILHRKQEPINTNRIMISREGMELEILPSKGMSIGRFSLDGKAVFWEPPQGLPDPEQLDFFSRDVYIFGEKVAGFEFLKTFAGGIELMGLENWGMPMEDAVTGETIPLHGVVGNIPLDRIDFEIGENGLTARGSFVCRALTADSSMDADPWYMRGRELYRITRILVLEKDQPGFTLVDTIRNVSGTALVPDWGYHVTFHPENGSRILVPSRTIEERWGGEVPPDHDTWKPAVDEKIRTEIGIIHKELKTFDSSGMPNTRILKLYPDGRTFELCLPRSPYFQTWFSSGGSDTDEFTYEDGSRLYNRPWNGFGVEFGSSALDHNGNTDKSVHYDPVLQAGGSIVNRISLRKIDLKEKDELKREIESHTGK